MRPRFQMRSLLVVFSVLVLLLYFLFVRPTVIAQRLATAVKNGEFEPGPSKAGAWNQEAWQHSEAELQPLNWNDVWGFQRRLKLVVQLTDNPVIDRVVLECTVGPIDYQLKRSQIEQLLPQARPSQISQ